MRSSQTRGNYSRSFVYVLGANVNNLDEPNQNNKDSRNEAKHQKRRLVGVSAPRTTLGNNHLTVGGIISAVDEFSSD
jgi:hypothetical protein